MPIGKRLVGRLVNEVVNAGDTRVLKEIYTEPMARAAVQWITPFRAAFPDFRMEIVQLVAEGSTVVARFRCSGTHLGELRGHPATGRRWRPGRQVMAMRLQCASAWPSSRVAALAADVAASARAARRAAVAGGSGGSP